MPYRFPRTAAATALALLLPATGHAQALLNGQTLPDRPAICPGGELPLCADGAPLSLAEAIERLAAQGDAAGVAQRLAGGGAVLCTDGAPAVCADGSVAFHDTAPTADQTPPEPAAAPDAATEAADGAEAAPELPEPADTAQDSATPEAPEPHADPAPEATASDAAADDGAESPSSGPVAGAEGGAAPEPLESASPEAEASESAVPEPEARAEAAPAPEATEPAPEALATAQTAEQTAQADRQPAPDAPDAGDRTVLLDREARRLIESLAGLSRPEAGDSAGALVALDRDGQASATQTLEAEIAEAETRQSDEDFATDPAGRPASGDPDRDRERLALLGLGALVVGAILANGDEVVGNTGDRVVVRRGEGDLCVLRDDNAILRRPGARVRTERFDDGPSRTFVTRDDGSVLITVRDASGRVVLREREGADGRRVVLIDDSEVHEPVAPASLPPPERRQVTLDQAAEADAAALRAALDRATVPGIARSFSLRQVREIAEVRKLVPEIAVRPITFATASAAIRPAEAQALAERGIALARLIEDDPREMFLIEGHTDAVGGAAYNLALSDRRAESVARALVEYFGIPPENLVVQGYGFTDLLIPTAQAEERNRRVAVRRNSPLLIDRLAAN